MGTTKIFNGKQKVKVAIAQTPPIFMDLAASTEKACRAIIEAGEHGAELIAFPEAWLPGYPCWEEHLASEVLPWANTRVLMYDNALVIPSRETDALCKAAKQARCNVVMGCNELDSSPANHTIYNTLLYIDSEGEIVGRHRKLTPTHAERAIWGVGDGSDLQVYETGIGRIAGLICGENSSSLFRYHLIAQGVQIHVMSYPGAATLDGPRMHEPDDIGTEFFGYPIARAHALEAGCFVLLVCGYFTEDQYPEDFPLKDKLFFDDFRGGSCMFAPGGMPLLEPVYGDRIVYGEFDADMIKMGKAVIDSVGHYARPDVVRLDWKPPLKRWRQTRTPASTQNTDGDTEAEKEIAT